jgi:hypothetical protein
MEDLLYSYPWTFWLLERGLSSLFVLLLLWCASNCWRTARSNQKLALGDALDYAQAERRGLLLPLGHQGGRPRF